MPRIPAIEAPPWFGGVVTPYASCVLAPNPSPMTLDGTNTWLLHDDAHAAVVDPGPDEPRHQRAIMDALERGAWSPTAVLVTHRHLDHAESAPALADRLGVPVHLPPLASGDGDPEVVHDIGTLVVRVLPTPGHTHDSVCLILEEQRALLTGDTVLGRGTSVIAPPDGDLGEYLTSLQRLRDRADGLTTLLPGHGPAQDDPIDVIEGYLMHRRTRLAEVRHAVEMGARDIDGIQGIVYPDIAPDLAHAARWSVRAQIAYLVSNGELSAEASSMLAD